MRISDWSSDVCSSDLGTAGQIAAERISGRYETGRQVSEIVVELSPKAADAVINRHLERGARTGLIAESGGIAHGAIAASGMHLQRSATAGPPHDAYIPNQTILIVAQPARRIFIGSSEERRGGK